MTTHQTVTTRKNKDHVTLHTDLIIRAALHEKYYQDSTPSNENLLERIAERTKDLKQYYTDKGVRRDDLNTIRVIHLRNLHDLFIIYYREQKLPGYYDPEVGDSYEADLVYVETLLEPNTSLDVMFLCNMCLLAPSSRRAAYLEYLKSIEKNHIFHKYYAAAIERFMNVN